jgi:hypothetical protein
MAKKVTEHSRCKQQKRLYTGYGHCDGARPIVTKPEAILTSMVGTVLGTLRGAAL